LIAWLGTTTALGWTPRVRTALMVWPATGAVRVLKGGFEANRGRGLLNRVVHKTQNAGDRSALPGFSTV